jgi:hypothetical protein
MIVKDIETVKKHLDINRSCRYVGLKPYLRSAERDFLKPIISLAQLKAFESEIDEAETEIIAAKELVEEAISNYAYYSWTPIGAIQVTSAGFVVGENQDARAATTIEKNEFQRSLKTMAHKTLDNLLELMELSPDKFPTFFASDEYTQFSSLLVNKTSIFNKWFYINNSMQTFLKLQPEIRIVEDQFLIPAIQKTLLTALKKNQTNEKRKEVKEFLEKACVAFTIAKVMDNGAYKFNGDSIIMRFDVLPYEQIKSVDNEFILRTKKNKMAEANYYLRLALNIIRSSTDFTEYVMPTETEKKPLLKKSGGIVGF